MTYFDNDDENEDLDYLRLQDDFCIDCFGLDEEGFDKFGFRAGYDRNGYDREGYNRAGFNAAGVHKNGTRFSKIDGRYFDCNGEERKETQFWEIKRKRNGYK